MARYDYQYGRYSKVNALGLTTTPWRRMVEWKYSATHS